MWRKTKVTAPKLTEAERMAIVARDAKEAKKTRNIKLAEDFVEHWNLKQTVRDRIKSGAEKGERSIMILADTIFVSDYLQNEALQQLEDANSEFSRVDVVRYLSKWLCELGYESEVCFMMGTYLSITFPESPTVTTEA